MKPNQFMVVRFWAIYVFLCASVPLWFNSSQAQKLPPQTEQQIRAILSSPELKEAHVGLSILDLGTVKDANAFPAKPFLGKPHRVLFEHDAHKKFMPASNMKLFTVAIALHLLGKEKTFATRVLKCPPHWFYSGAAVSSSSPLSCLEPLKLPPEGWTELALVGGGDPSFGEAGVEALAKLIAAAGIKRIDYLAGDGRLFGGETSRGRYPFGWTLDDALWYYGPEISALAFNRNQADITLTGANQVGDDARFECPPDVDIYSHVKTGLAHLSSKQEEELIEIERRSGYFDGVQLNGEIAVGQVVKLGLAVPNPPLWAVDRLSDALSKAGVRGQQARALTLFNPEQNIFSKHNHLNCEVIASHDSPPLQILFHRLLKNSDNLYAEMILRNAAYYHDGTGGDKAGPRAHELLKKWLITQDIDTTALRFEDGSGLSRYNLLTPRATAELLAAINRMKDGDAIYDALPIAGADGTLKERMKTTRAANNVRAKTGTFSIASNLSGYVTTRDNHRLAVAFYINFARDTNVSRKAQDKLFAILADAKWEK